MQHATNACQILTPHVAYVDKPQWRARCRRLTAKLAQVAGVPRLPLVLLVLLLLAIGSLLPPALLASNGGL
jgi:hypothetical protein